METTDLPVVLIGGSAGSVEVLKELAATLPADLPAAVCIVVHIPQWTESKLAGILHRAGNLPAEQATQGRVLEPGGMYLAPPGLHLTFDGDTIRLMAGPKENGHRPAIDPMFRSGADTFGPLAVGVLISGASEDGTNGLAALKAAGASLIVQDPEDATYPKMPESALEFVDVDFVLPASQIAPAIQKTVARLVEEKDRIRAARTSKADLPPGADPGHPRPGRASPFTCPECGGTLWESEDPVRPDYQCRVGHAFSSEALSESQAVALESAMWSALRSLEEAIALSERIAKRARARNNELTAERYERRAARLTDQARLIRQVVIGTESQETESTR